MLPVFAFPTLLGIIKPDSPIVGFVWLYPLYVLASGVCSYICYPERRDVSWILIILMLLAHAGIWYLACNPA